MEIQSVILDVIFKYNLQLIPLRSIVNGQCTCGNPDCSSPGKHPLFNYSWKIIATNDRKKIEGWLKKYQEINFAVPTGRFSNISNKYLTVIDVDKEEHEIINALPATFCYKTGGGGYHFWYWTRNPIKNSVSLIANKVDVRGNAGYVVIPPSKHISGKNYELLPNSIHDIVDLPEKISQLLNIKKIKEEKKQPKKKQPGEVPDIVNFWGAFSIPEIRDMLASGSRIPEGVRNVTIFRLLSSDRAKGVLTKQDLLLNAANYVSFCENGADISNDEIDKIVISVMKYPPYNNSHEKVNETYVRWLEKKGVEKTPLLHKHLNELDDAFFKGLKPSDRGVSLETISRAREEFFKTKGLTQFSNYKPSLLGIKLRNLGFSRIRTAKCNLWNVDLEGFQNEETSKETEDKKDN